MKPSEIKAQFKKKTEVKTTIHCDYNDIDWIINEVFHNEQHEAKYGQNLYEMLAYEETGTSQGPSNWNWESGCDDDYFDDERQEEFLSKVNSGKWPKYSTGKFLTILAQRGLIPEGEYIVNTSW